MRLHVSHNVAYVTETIIYLLTSGYLCTQPQLETVETTSINKHVVHWLGIRSLTYRAFSCKLKHNKVKRGKKHKELIAELYRQKRASKYACKYLGSHN